jgi:very-short-patch-repair endonuclease
MSIERARELRRNMTYAERRMWWLLRKKQLGGLRFRRQAPLGPYYADFFCPKARLVVELDGARHTSDSQIAHDEQRDRWFESQGIRVLRISNREFFERPDEIADAIYRVAASPHPPHAKSRSAPSPARGEG